MKEIRICEIRADAAAGVEQALRLEGRPIVYDQPTKINDPAGAFIGSDKGGSAGRCRPVRRKATLQP